MTHIDGNVVALPQLNHVGHNLLVQSQHDILAVLFFSKTRSLASFRLQRSFQGKIQVDEHSSQCVPIKILVQTVATVY